MVERYKYKCIDAYEEPENPMEWLPCPRCGLRPLVWKFDNGRATACGCGTDCCCHGGCNLCMDISKYNIKGLKIYGG